MKRTLAMITAVMMASAAPALAGDAMKKNAVDAQLGTSTETQVEAGANAGTSTDLDAGADADLGIDTDTTASTGADVNFGSVISAIQADKTSPAELKTMTDVSNVEIVRVSELEGSDSAALDNALEKNNAQVEELRDAIEDNPALTEKLDQELVEVSSVVATEMETDGSLTIYVR